VGEDGLDGERVLDAGDNAQLAATARPSEDIEGEQEAVVVGGRGGASSAGVAADLQEAKALLDELA
jgi:hypothetical protein